MHWGVRKDDDIAGRLQAPGPKIDPTLHPATKESAVRVASLISQRYGFRTREIIGFEPGHPDISDSSVGGASTGALGYVNITGSSKPEGDIFVSREDTRIPLRESEKAKWVGKGCGTTEAFLTHESAHAVFHQPQRIENGVVVGGNIEARNKAMQAAVNEAIRKRIPDYLFLNSLSGYAQHAGNRQEVEAELFSQYHWGTKPPSFVKVWGETLHREMGIDDTPFRKVR